MNHTGFTSKTISFSAGSEWWEWLSLHSGREFSSLEQVYSSILSDPTVSSRARREVGPEYWLVKVSMAWMPSGFHACAPSSLLV